MPPDTTENDGGIDLDEVDDDPQQAKPLIEVLDEPSSEAAGFSVVSPLEGPSPDELVEELVDDDEVAGLVEREDEVIEFVDDDEVAGLVEHDEVAEHEDEVVEFVGEDEVGDLVEHDEAAELVVEDDFAGLAQVDGQAELAVEDSFAGLMEDNEVVEHHAGAPEEDGAAELAVEDSFAGLMEDNEVVEHHAEVAEEDGAAEVADDPFAGLMEHDEVVEHHAEVAEEHGAAEVADEDPFAGLMEHDEVVERHAEVAEEHAAEVADEDPLAGLAEEHGTEEFADGDEVAGLAEKDEVAELVGLHDEVAGLVEHDEGAELVGLHDEVAGLVEHDEAAELVGLHDEIAGLVDDGADTFGETTVELDGVEELEEIEELDDFEVIEEPAAAPPPPPRAAAPPPSPPRAPSAPPPSVPALVEAAEVVAPVLLDPDPESVLDQLLEGRVTLDWSVRAQHLSKELEQAEGKSRIGELAYELGELYSRHLKDEGTAVEYFGKALQADPSLRANLWAIRRIFYRRELWPNLVKLIGAEARFAADGVQRADLQVERAHILETRLDDISEAKIAYDQAVAAQPGNFAALLGLERISRITGDKETLWRALTGLAQASSGAERKASFLLDLAREYRLSHERYDEARALLTEATALDVLHGAVAAEREALAVAAGDVSGLAASLERRIAALSVELESDECAQPEGIQREIVTYRRQQAQALQADGDMDAAWGYLQEALAVSPNDPLLLVDLAEMAESLGRYDELAELVAACEQGEVDPAKALGLAVRRAAALAKAGKHSEADELLAARSVASPGYLPLVAAREIHAGALTDWRRLAELQAELAESIRLGTCFGPGTEAEGDNEAAAAHYVVSGDLLRFGAEDAGEAKTRYKQALDVYPGYVSALQALVAVCCAERLFDAAILVIEEHLEAVPEDSKRALLESLAGLCLLTDKRQEELACVRRMQALEQEEAESRELGSRVLELLREVRAYEELASECVALASAESNPDNRGRLWFEAGRLYMYRLGRPDDAANCFQTCLADWPEDEITSACLLGALRAGGNWEQVATYLEDEIESCADGPRLVELGREALSVSVNMLGDSSRSRSLALRLVERAPENLAVLLDAVVALNSTDDASQPAVADVLARIVACSDGELQLHSLLWLGTIHSRLGRITEAEECLQQATKQGSIAAALQLYRMSAEQGDTQSNTESLVALAGLLESADNRGSMLELAGWQCALALNEDEAAALFARASEIDPLRFGAVLGAVLVAAKQGDQELHGERLARLADVCEGAYLQSSLLLRAGLIAEVLGDESLADARLSEARSIAEQDAGAVVVLADRLAPLGPQSALSPQQLVERAELCSMRAVLADTGSARNDWELERADALERAGRLAEAAQATAFVLDQRPDDIRALGLLRRICLRGEDYQSFARCCVSLAKVIGDAEGRLALLREAVEVFDDKFDDAANSVATYRAILEEDPGAQEYERLISLLVEHVDLHALYQCYSARLNHLDVEGDQYARLPILFARGRLRERIGDLRGAARDFAAVLQIDEEHLEGLFERARILERLGEAEESVALYQAFVSLEMDPGRRAPAELSLSRLLADSLDDLSGAVEQLEHVLQSSPEDSEVRDRLVALLVKGGRINDAVSVIRDLSSLRSSDGERARDELRIADLHRGDADSEAALASLMRAKKYDPLNIDVVRDLVALTGESDSKRDEVIHSAISEIRLAIDQDPLKGGLYERLVTIGQWTEDVTLQRHALQALALAANLSAEQERLVASLGAPEVREGSSVSPQQWRDVLCHQDTRGFISELWGLIGPAVAQIAGATPVELGFDRSQRVKDRLLAGQYPVVAEFLSVLDLPEIEVYISPQRMGVARAVTAEVPMVCFGADIASGASPEQRFTIARTLAHAKAGTGTAAELELEDLCLYLAAAATIAGVLMLPETLVSKVELANVEEKAKELSKALGRRSRKSLSLLASRFDELGHPGLWKRAVQTSVARAGLLLCGSLRAAFEVLDVGKGGRALADHAVAQELMAWSLGDHYIQLRQGIEDVRNTDA